LVERLGDSGVTHHENIVDLLVQALHKYCLERMIIGVWSEIAELIDSPAPALPGKGYNVKSEIYACLLRRRTLGISFR
jgi:hypothetical protein